MIDRVNPLALARAAILPAACITVMGYFAFHAISGNAGLIAWQGYKTERAAVDADAAKVGAVKAALQRQVALLDPHHVDKDYADERVRRDLGVVGPNEVIIPLPDAK
ncbi:FtsB family cell division protein [Glacieibacterium megasporae]|uniref:FtsB family cell division protein n=1 Tax=Glacieibacterium megasporae TaxID=2835787 RepID=UPI001C1E7CE3|nr:septum formation initiator family protein [Polymorphobacter megasporae]UAJ09413.1 septum formation initiator family protein [Polymorphobacter megasporae]